MAKQYRVPFAGVLVAALIDYLVSLSAVVLLLVVAAWKMANLPSLALSCVGLTVISVVVLSFFVRWDSYFVHWDEGFDRAEAIWRPAATSLSEILREQNRIRDLASVALGEDLKK